jgi:hypothetical protein
MSKTACLTVLTLFLIASTAVIFAQKNNGVEVIPRLSADKLAKQCKNLEIGKIVFYFTPETPPQALVEQDSTVNVTINIQENGLFLGIVSIDGKSPFLEVAIKAAQKVKFSPTLCDGKPIPVSAVMTYIFTPTKHSESYFIPEKTEDYKDVNQESPFYESIFYLTENYKISFGYSDNKFHEEINLNKGDFTHFLKLTLDLVIERARFANKNPKEINLFSPYNPNNLTSINEIKDLNKKSPSNDSAIALFNKYKISLVNENFELDSSANITQNEVIEIWSHIFGKEALPINFEKTVDNGKLITRGEFALFLQESLRVLTYKVLP